MCALAHWFERAAVPTVVIGLVPQHVERMRPPRALLVPFELGRPLGAPDRALQGRVLDAALSLAERVDVPVVSWFEEDVDVTPGEADGWACPVSFAPPAAPGDDLELAVLAEVRLLQPWHDRAVIARGSSAVGASGLEVTDAVRYLAAHLLPSLPEVPDPRLSGPETFKLAAEDLKQFYLEAANARPGGTSRDLAAWFWQDTSAARLLVSLVARLRHADDIALRIYSQATLVPERWLAPQR